MRKDRTPRISVTRPLTKLSVTQRKESAENGRRDGTSTNLNEEHPSPTRGIADTTHVEQAIGHQGSRDIGKCQGRPEEAQTNGELVVLVEIGQVENDLEG